MSAERAAVIGTGRIGLCLLLTLERSGYEVLGIDRDRDLVGRIMVRSHRTPEPGVDQALARARAFRVDDDLRTLDEFGPSIVFVTVDTPGVDGGGYDHRNVDAVLAALTRRPVTGRRIDLVLMCTTMPGYVDSWNDAAAGAGYALSYSPSFVAQGTVLLDLQQPDVVLIGEADAEAGDRLVAHYRRTCRNQPAVHRMSRLSAEIAKLATNCALTMKIAFANAIGDLAVRAGAQPDRILAAVGDDSRIGRRFLEYGYGYGGPCLPRDNRALNLFARTQGMELLQGEATDEMNRRHLAFQVEECLRTSPALDPIVFDSVTYKPGSDLLEESQPLALAARLARAGRRVVIGEAVERVAELQARFGDLFEYRPRSVGKLSADASGPRAGGG